MTTTRNKGALYGDDGKIFMQSNNRRFLVAKCKPEITVYEKATQVNVRGIIGHKEKLMYCSIILCPNAEIVHEMNNDFIRTVTACELVFDIADENAVIESLKIEGLTSDDLDYSGIWEFEAVLPSPLAVKLLRYLK